MERTINHDAGANLYVVTGADGYVLECFDTNEQASAYLAEFESNVPKTAGEVVALAKKHGALFRWGVVVPLGC